MGFIYCITNVINNKKYVGKTANTIEERFKEHKQDSKRKRCEKRPLYDAFNKYGFESFKIEKLEECENDTLSSRESFWIDKLNTFHNGYNVTKGGDGTILYDYDLIISLIKQGKTTSQIKEIVGCCSDTVLKIAKTNNLVVNNPPNTLKQEMIKKRKNIYQFSKEKDFIQKFDSINAASKWLFENGYAKANNQGVRSHLSDVANGKRKTAYTFLWSWTEEII